MKETILVVDDEEDIRKNIRRFLEPRGYKIVTAQNGSEAFALAGETRPHLVITDVDMPDLDGFALSRLLKAKERLPPVPVIIISGKAIDDKSVIKGLDEGADDYLIKPVSLPVLLARVKAVLRRYRRSEEAQATIERLGIELDAAKRSVKVDGSPVSLTRKEFDLLAALLTSNGRVLSPQYLLEEVWGYELELYNNPHTVEVHVSKLRKKLGEKVGRLIQRVTGLGFKLAEDGSR